MQLFKRNKGKGLDSSNLIPLFILGTLGLQCFNLLLNSGSVISQWAIAHKPAPAMVQLLDGHSVAMEPVETTQRTPALIRQFTKDALSLMFTWNSKIPVNDSDQRRGTSIIKDAGVSVGSGRITTSSWQASFSLTEDFRNAFLEQIAKLTPSEVFVGGAQSVLSFESISQPKPIVPGKWQVDVVANLLLFDSTHPQGMVVPFNKSIFIRASEPTTDPLPDHSTPIQQAVYRIQTGGLQIYEIRDLDIQQLNQ